MSRKTSLHIDDDLRLLKLENACKAVIQSRVDDYQHGASIKRRANLLLIEVDKLRKAHPLVPPDVRKVQ